MLKPPSAQLYVLEAKSEGNKNLMRKQENICFKGLKEFHKIII